MFDCITGLHPIVWTEFIIIKTFVYTSQLPTAGGGVC